MSKHTEGPWVVGSRYVVGPRDDSDTQMRGLVVGVADVYGENRDADARLIAAAPELLEALKEFVHPYQSGTLTERELREKALAAIAKAEGRA